MKLHPVCRSATGPFVGLLLLVAVPLSAAEDPRKREPTSWDVKLSPPGEPGDPFEMTGTLRTQAGDSLPNRKMFFYHADALGNYTLAKDGPLHLAAVLRTDAKGRYRIRSVFPGMYGGPPHVHYEVLDAPRGAGFVNLRREGDTRPGSFMLAAHRDKDGVWRLKVDLKPTGGTPVLPTPPGANPSYPEIRYPPPSLADSAR
jgi:hypothetical protein